MPEIVEMEQLAAEAPVGEYDSYTEYLANLGPDLILKEDRPHSKSTYYGALKQLISDISRDYDHLPGFPYTITSLQIKILARDHSGCLQQSSYAKFWRRSEIIDKQKEARMIRDSLRPKQQCASRIVIIHGEYMNLPGWAIDGIGLGLDIEPGFFLEYYNMIMDVNKSGGLVYDELPVSSVKLPHSWNTKSRYLCVSGIWLLLLTGPDDIKTGVLLARDVSLPPSLFTKLNPQIHPSEISQNQQGHMSDRIQSFADYVVGKIRNIVERTPIHGPDSFRFICVEALLEYEAMQMSVTLPYFSDWNGPFYLKQRAFGREETWRHEFHPQTLWNGVRGILDDTKEVLLRLPSYVNRNLDMNEPDLERRYEHLSALFAEHVARIGNIEQRLREQLAVVASVNSIEMAERAIWESKRVMLFTALAFLFFPVSLATNVFSMNIYEINSSGHRLWVFIATAICLSIVVILLLKLLMHLEAYDHLLALERNEERRRRVWRTPSWMEKIFFVRRS